MESLPERKACYDMWGKREAHQGFWETWFFFWMSDRPEKSIRKVGRPLHKSEYSNGFVIFVQPSLICQLPQHVSAKSSETKLNTRKKSVYLNGIRNKKNFNMSKQVQFLLVPNAVGNVDMNTKDSTGRKLRNDGNTRKTSLYLNWQAFARNDFQTRKDPTSTARLLRKITKPQRLCVKLKCVEFVTRAPRTTRPSKRIFPPNKNLQESTISGGSTTHHEHEVVQARNDPV